MLGQSPGTTKYNWRLTEEQKQEAVAMYEEGDSCGTIAKRFGVSRNSMHGVLRRRTEMRSNLRWGAENNFWRGGQFDDDLVHNKLEQAIIKGEVIRPTTCEACGDSGTFKDGRTKIQAHHSDYNKPLTVQWLCQPCHHEWHKNNKAVPKEVT